MLFERYQTIKFACDTKSGRRLLSIHVLKEGTDPVEESKFFASQLSWLEALARDTELSVQTSIRNNTNGVITLALGELDDAQAHQTLQQLTKNRDKKLARAAANGLFGGRKTQRAESAPTQQRLQRLRGDSQPQTHISVLKVIRALPTAGPYEELALTEIIARHCTAYATTRRLLVEPNEGPALMQRQKGTYTLTATGAAVWRLETFIKENYLQGL